MCIAYTYIHMYNVCISILVFRDSKTFQDTCERVRQSDDLTTGTIIGILLIIITY